MTQQFVFFWKSHSPFSQWYSSPFKATAMFGEDQKTEYTFSNTEQFMMFNKALLFGDIRTSKRIMACFSPRNIKSLGRGVRGFKESVWKKYREEIVIQGSYLKFSQNEKLKQILLNTGEKTLVEASPFDRIWGVGMKASDPGIKNPKNWKGKNLLGTCLMRVRDSLNSKA